MITSVCANPAIDKAVLVDGFKVGTINRIDEWRADASGKGINVAISSKRLGAQVTCIGFNFSDNGHLECERLQSEGIEYDFIYSPGSIRTNIKIIDRKTGVMTELNEKGEAVSADAIKQLETIVAEKAAKSSFMVFA
ncbi:MAG TPA: PfkB family carbohydrate kinase, partial [Clostridia bacterium]|nr:PfkB family carbohydrate kinase [Clostridia bacterium]